MSEAPNPAQSAAFLSSDPSSSSIPSMQDHTQARRSPAVANLPANDPLYESDEDLSDAPESPVFPTLPTPSTRYPRVPSSDSDSDLSDAPDSPFWPEVPKALQIRPRCTEKDCPVRKAIRRHCQGPYLHGGKPPRTNETIFGDSNPPAHVWESWKNIQAKDCSSTVDDDWNVLGFLRWHVENPNTNFMGI